MAEAERSGRLDAWRTSLDDLRRDLARLRAIAPRYGTDAAALDALDEKLRTGAFDVVVLGAFKRGKSTFINALLAEPLLPAGVVPVTSVMTVLRHGDRPEATVYFEDGRTEPIALSALADYIAESHNPDNRKGVDRVEVAHPAPILRSGIHIVDTPGVGSVYHHQTDVAYQVLPRADAAVMLLTADPPISEAELAFVRDVRPYAGKLFFLLNKVDRLSGPERHEALAFTRAVLERELGHEVEVYTMAALVALHAAQACDVQGLEQSGFAAFLRRLEGFLLAERGGAQLQSSRQALVRLARSLLQTLRIERRTLEMPVSELESSLQAFRVATGDLSRQRREVDLVLDAEARALVAEFNDRLERFKDQARPPLLAAFDERAKAMSAPDGKALAEAIERLIRQVVEEHFTAWQQEMEQAIDPRLAQLMSLYAGRVNELIARLHGISEDLFRLPASPLAVPEEPAPPPAFRYKFVEFHETALSMSLDALMRALPASLARRTVLKAARERLVFLFDTQINWLRQDLNRRIVDGLRAFQREVGSRLDASLQAVESAVRRGTAQREAGAAALDARLATYQQDESELMAVESTWTSD